MIECVGNVFRKKMTEVLLSFTLDVCVFDQRERISSHQKPGTRQDKKCSKRVWEATD